MRKLFLLILLFTLALVPCVSARTVVMVGGGVAAGRCTPTDSQTEGTTFGRFGYDTTVDQYYIASSFTASGAGTYSIKTLYLFFKKTSSPTFDATVYLCPNSTDKPDVDSNCTVADSQPFNASDLSTDSTEKKFNFTDGYSVTNGGKHWIKVKASAVHNLNFANLQYYNSVATESVFTSADDSTWSSTGGDATGQATFTATTCLE